MRCLLFRLSRSPACLRFLFFFFFCFFHSYKLCQYRPCHVGVCAHDGKGQMVFNTATNKTECIMMRCQAIKPDHKIETIWYLLLFFFCSEALYRHDISSNFQSENDPRDTQYVLRHPQSFANVRIHNEHFSLQPPGEGKSNVAHLNLYGRHDDIIEKLLLFFFVFFFSFCAKRTNEQRAYDN